ncbi:hypothetical protein HRbin10_00999 [bacterium HR10]|nr:hypothetical protein HRbin10_00999 [bacterium HR10]
MRSSIIPATFDASCRGRRVPKWWGYVAVLGLAALNSAMFDLIYTHHRQHSNIDETPLEYHSTIEPRIVRELDRYVGGNWRYLMLAFVSPIASWTEVDSRLKYLNVLEHHYADQGLRAMIISSDVESHAHWLHKDAHVNPTIVNDETFKFYRAFRTHPDHEHGSLVILDKQGRIEFFTYGIPSEDELRQLAEKYMVGSITYALAEDGLVARFVIGAPLPDLSLRSLDGGEQLVLNEAQRKNLILVIFTARCATCQIEHFMNELAAFRSEVARSTRYRSHQFLVIFASNFRQTSLLSYQSTGILPSSTYFLDQEPIPLEKYATRYDISASRPTVVITDASGKVAEVAPLFSERISAPFAPHPRFAHPLSDQHKRPRESVEIGLLTATRVFPEVNGASVIKIDKSGNYLVLNPKDHSIVVYDHRLKFIRRIGRIGNGPGEFYDPVDFAVDNQGRLYIADSGNNRIQILRSDGTYLRHFRFPAPISVAALRTGEILIVGANDDQLVHVYSPGGEFLGLSALL